MPVSISTGEPCEFDRHMKMLDINPGAPCSRSEVETAPIFTQEVREGAQSLLGSNSSVITQYGLLGGMLDEKKRLGTQVEGRPVRMDPRLFYNVAAPSSVFICGSQGSGKSHTLSCLLESCLLPSPLVNALPRPLSGIIFHYDTFSSDTGGFPCEAASLSSNRNVSVRVLCAPTNIRHIKKIYGRFRNISVQELRISQDQLNTGRMLDLMAIRTTNTDKWPLYMSTVTKVLREMRLSEQISGSRGFNYQEFKKRLAAEDLTPGQLAPLQQRLGSLESFMVASHTKESLKKKKVGTSPTTPAPPLTGPSLWDPKPRQLTIVDLSCPCVSVVTACALFNVCLALFLESRSEIGRVVALDEAHKYMTDSAESETLTKSLLSAIRLQRHLATRIFISTQEPTVSPSLLDLCSATIVHRFTSPAWLSCLSQHLAGASGLLHARKSSLPLAGAIEDPEASGSESSETTLRVLFARIVALRTGEALLFSPSTAMRIRRSLSRDRLESFAKDALVETRVISEVSGEESEVSQQSSEASVTDMPDGSELVRLGHRALKIRIRQRITEDCGRSRMAK